MLVPGTPSLRAIIFDLDEALLLRSEAWRYAVEEAVVSVTGQRIDARPLCAEYRTRPWRHALSIVLSDLEQIGRCEALCTEMFQRSCMKKLLVHDGIGVALDSLRGLGVEMGAISHEPHALAIKQVQSTGLDRFLSVLSTTPEGSHWDPAERFADCLAFLERDASQCAFVAPAAADLRAVEAAGATCYEAAWAAMEPSGYPALGGPGELKNLAR